MTSTQTFNVFVISCTLKIETFRFKDEKDSVRHFLNDKSALCWRENVIAVVILLRVFSENIVVKVT